MQPSLVRPSNQADIIDRLRNEIQRSFDEKLEMIQKANNRTFVSIQKCVKQACQCQNVSNKINQNTDIVNHLFKLLPLGNTI